MTKIIGDILFGIWYVVTQIAAVLMGGDKE